MQYKDAIAEKTLERENNQSSKTASDRPLLSWEEIFIYNNPAKQNLGKMTSQEELDNITRLAAYICQSAIALIYLTDGTQQWFASEGSLEGLQISTDSACHAYALLHKDLLIIEDTWQDTKLTTTALATFIHSIRFYVGIPLINCQGDSLGCLCLMDVKPRQFTTLQKEGLQILANHVTNQLESRHLTSQVLRESETSFQLLVQSVKDYAIFMLDPNGYIITWNEGAAKIKGYQPKEIIGQHFSRFYPQEDILRNKPNRVLKMAAAEGRFEEEAWRVRKDRSRFWANVVITPLRDESGKLKGFAKVTRDITERKRAEEQLIHNAFHDALTGLPNRALFIERLAHEVRYAKRHPEYLFAVLFLDIDRFKTINESLGHAVGDSVLKAIAQRLETIFKSTDAIARFGGDAFTILLEDIKSISEATLFAHKINQELAFPFYIQDKEIFINVSIGIALNLNTLTQPDDLLRDAEIAMFRAKTAGRARYQVFDASMHDRAVRRLQLENDLRRAITGDELRLFYQPIVSLITGKITGFEALLRWQHPQKGWVYPGEFIPLAEETGLILPMDLWVLRESCRQLKQWQIQYPNHRHLTINVNLSGQQFSQPNLLEKIDLILAETGLDAEHLKLEITEAFLINKPEEASATLKLLKKRQIKLAIDDFGTGYCGLNYLHRFPLDTLKIDRSFVSKLGVEREVSIIVEAIVSLAHNLGMEVVAEGIETKEQQAQLQAMQCEYGQGYLLSKPLDKEAAQLLIASSSL